MSVGPNTIPRLEAFMRLVPEFSATRFKCSVMARKVA